MDKYYCTACSWEYDPAVGVPDQGIAPGTVSYTHLDVYKRQVYGAFSKPKGRLYLSYSALDGRGTPRGRSPVVSDLLRLFPELRVYPAQAYGNARGYAVTAQSGAAAARTAAGAYGRGEAVDGSFGALYRVCRDRMGWEEPDLHRLDHLDEGLAEELFLPKGAVSATRMERYARCPFSHFVESGLRPQEIREPGVAPRDRGDILHEALEKVVALRKGCLLYTSSIALTTET